MLRLWQTFVMTAPTNKVLEGAKGYFYGNGAGFLNQTCFNAVVADTLISPLQSVAEPAFVNFWPQLLRRWS